MSIFDKELKVELNEFMLSLVNIMEWKDFLSFPSEHSWYEVCRLYDDDPDDRFELHNGCTKGVIVLKDYDCVLKIGFSANDEEGIDYCEIECANYQQAIEEYLDEYYAATDYLKSYYGTTVYIQEKVICDSDAIEDESYKAALHSFCNKYNIHEYDLDLEVDLPRFWCVKRTTFRDMFESSCSFDDDSAMYDFFGQTYGDDVQHDLEWFNDRRSINDIHSGNVGYRYSTGKIVFIDYSGYGMGYDEYMRLIGA